MKRQYKKSQSGLFLPAQGTGIQHGKSGSVGPIIMACGSISGGVVVNCSSGKPVAGTETTIYLANRADIDFPLTFNVSNNLIVEAITMVATKVFYAFTGIKQSNNPIVRMNRTKYMNNWQHLLDFLIFSNDGAAKKIIMDLSNSEVCAIVQNKWKGTNGSMAYELYGASVGMVLVAAERNPNDAETASAWKLSLGPDEGQFEDNVPYTIFDTDQATTDSLIAALL